MKKVRYTGYSRLLKVPEVFPSKNIYFMCVAVE